MTQSRLFSLLKAHPEIELIVATKPLMTSKDAAEYCNISADQGIKTIIVKTSNGEFAALILCGHDLVDRNAVRKLLGARKMRFATAEETLEQSGFIVGGVAPLGFAKDLRVIVDTHVLQNEEVFGGGGTPEKLLRLDPKLIVSINSALVVDIAARAE